MRHFIPHFYARPRAAKPSRKEGQTLVEYSLILAIVALLMIASVSLLGSQVVKIFSAITTLLDTAQGSH